ncbi:hypothetical protein [Nannocystis pusilla]|uniref:Arrestin-like N-terminal domain-containing protein n=1 Tax=Nannocystis pusilla TaxID=889268 RepID=A0ABS7TT11_9BACT|nr:hypothetical protein [Nannocystis pusilla]MBZ5711287.1 hypothetical protein [Nannocystis pusilla]
MADLDIRAQDPDNSGLVLVGILFVLVGVPGLLYSAFQAPGRFPLAEQAGLLFELGFALIGLAALAIGFSSYDLRREPQEDGSLRLACRGTAGLGVVFLGFVAATASFSVAVAGLTWSSWPLLVCALLAIPAFVRQSLSYCTHLSLHLSPGEPRPGQALTVRWRVSAPARVHDARAVLIAEERAEHLYRRDARIEVKRVHELRVGADDVATLPAGAVPTLLLGPHTIAWRLEFAADLSFGPGFSMTLPLLVRGAQAGDAPPRDDAPQLASPARHEPALTLQGGHREFAPGDAIAGEITWERASAPVRATLRLVWQSRAALDPGERREVVRRISVSRLPQVAAHGSDDPYRGAGESEETGVALAAGERRRFRLVAPEAPPSYRGALFHIDWWLELEVDDDAPIRVPLVVGPGRAALTCAVELAAQPVARDMSTPSARPSP